MATFWETKVSACFLGVQHVLFVFLLFVKLIISRFGFEGWIGVLIAPVPDLCMLFTFVIVLVIFLLTGSKKHESCYYL